MDMTSSAVWFAIALLFLSVVVTKIVSGRLITSDRRRLPPVVNGLAMLVLVPIFIRNGRQATIQYLHTKFGSVFTISLFGLKLTFLIGPEVADHFFQGLDSEISYGKIYEFTVPMFGQAVGYGIDSTTQNEQMRFSSDSMTPLNLRRKVEPMLQEVKDYFSQWGEDGIVDLKHELKHLLMLISSRALLGREVREEVFMEFCQLFSDIQGSANMINLLFPYVPILTNRQRDRARIKLIEILSEIVRSRKLSGPVGDGDMLQKFMDSRYRDGRSTTEEEIAGLCIAIFFAANHTCSHAITWTAAYLLSHEDCLTTVVEEQKNIIRENKDRIDYNILSHMHFLHRCIKEALRMHPPVPVFLRKAHMPFTVRTKQGDQYDIPKDHILASPTILNHNMSYIYKNPQQYDPDRFGPERKEDKIGGKFSYTSFGAGRHACFGEAYAYMKFKMIWSYMLRNFEVKLLSSFPIEDSRKFVPEPQGKMMVSYKRLR
ncbi:hypothetical protein CFC21_059866 [Triticum aestivum]|uniref:Obtusifoliol 14-alpha demethylase n=2 Tax=Triticum aestivum TaxID=4565 RepID=A0A9R1GR32_WHEAT|nr:obtusifoliol 14-alpha demethylase-like [Triticum aestivum]KAF7051643.1 hypothetical protein CFC21_059866 [Triticum aestivum]